MDEYTFKDLIIDPETSGLENLIGKEVYFDDVPIHCIKWANEDYEVGILKDVRKDNPAPFFVKTSSGCVLNYPCIIPKKEEPKKYVPFENGQEFFNSYLSVESRLEKEDYFLSNHGIWLMDCENGDYFLVTEIWGDGVVLGSNQTTTHWDDLLEEFIFLDGSPCGKESKDE